MTIHPPKTPSGFHGDARRRTPSHDRMQTELLAFLRGRPYAALPTGAPVHRVVEAEYPLVRNGQVVAFLDAVEIVTIALSSTVNLFEIKPKIETVFGVIRQAKAGLVLAYSTIRADVLVYHIVVPWDDPLLGALRQEWPRTWGWEIPLG